MFAQIREKTKELNAQIESLQKEAAAMVKPMLQEFLKDHPQVKQVSWSQYTPYFNDGDACVFGVNEPYFQFVGDDENEDRDDDGYDSWSLGSAQYGPSAEVCSAETAAACKELSRELQSIEGALETLFGDHVKVIVTADGVDVDEYSHD